MSSAPGSARSSRGRFWCWVGAGSQQGHNATAYSFGLLASRIPKPNLSNRRTTLLLLMLQRVGRERRREGETVTDDRSYKATALSKELERVWFCSHFRSPKRRSGTSVANIQSYSCKPHQGEETAQSDLSKGQEQEIFPGLYHG